MMMAFRADLKQLNSLGWSVVDQAGCQQNGKTAENMKHFTPITLRKFTIGSAM